MSPAARRRYIIEFDADNVLTAQAKVGAMRTLGVELDDDYGVVPIDASLTHFVTRGQASHGALESIQTQFGARVFNDGVVGPA